MKCNLPGKPRMATICFLGKVTCKEGTEAVTFKELPTKDGSSTLKIASFSARDTQYAYFKNKEDNPGQFYRCEVTGKLAEQAQERLKRGDYVGVSGQAVWRQYNDKKILDIKNCALTFVDSGLGSGGDSSSIDPSSMF